MEESNWKVLGVTNLFPVAVKLHNKESDTTFSVPTLYNPNTNDVYLLHGNDVMGFSKEVIDAVRESFERNFEVGIPVSIAVLEEIKILSGLIKKPEMPPRE